MLNSQNSIPLGSNSLFNVNNNQPNSLFPNNQPSTLFPNNQVSKPFLILCILINYLHYRLIPSKTNRASQHHSSLTIQQTKLLIRLSQDLNRINQPTCLPRITQILRVFTRSSSLISLNSFLLRTSSLILSSNTQIRIMALFIQMVTPTLHSSTLRVFNSKAIICNPTVNPIK